MASIVVDREWIGALDEHYLRRTFGEVTYERAVRYARAGQVERIESGDHGRLLTARVRGTRSAPYQCLVVAADRGRTVGRGDPSPAAPGTRCSCPVQVACKHAVALIIAARELAFTASPTGAVAGGGSSDAPAWERSLAAVAARLSTPSIGSGTTPMAIQVGVVPARVGWRGSAAGLPDGVGSTGLGPQVRLRLVVRGASGRWVRSTVTWEQLRYPPLHVRLDPEQRAAAMRLRDLHGRGAGWSFSSVPAQLSLAELGSSVWADLARCVEAGIELVPERDADPPVRLATAPATLRLELRRDGRETAPVAGAAPGPGADDAGLVIDAAFAVDGRIVPVTGRNAGGDAGDSSAPADVSLVGTPPHGLVLRQEGELVLAGLDAPLDEARSTLLGLAEEVRVPPGDVPRFLSTYFPVLRRRLDLVVADDVEVPEVEPLRLALDVAFEAGDQVTLRWSYLYGGRAGTRLPLAPSRTDPAIPVRDPAAERAVVQGLPETDLSRSLTHQVGLHRQLVPVQRFHGLDTILIATELLPALRDRDDIVVTVHAQPPPYREAQQAPRIEVSISDLVEGSPSRSERQRPGRGDSGRSDPGQSDPGESRRGTGRTPPAVSPAVSPDRGATDWFDLGIDVTIDGESVPFAQLFTALAQGADHLVLASGTWFRLDRPELEELRRLIEEARGLSAAGDLRDGTLRLAPVHAGLWEELVALGVVREQSQAWERSAGALLALDPGRRLEAADVPAGVRATLRPYQVEGFAWLALLWDARLGGVLADDMGLGKTLQMLSLAERARAAGELDDAPLLVVAPTSVVSTWASEAATFTPELRVATVTQTAAKRGASLAEVAGGAHVVVTSYTLLRLEADDYAARGWSGLVLDEAQFVKNRASKVYQSVRRVPAPVRFVISGTPLENNLMDLWSLLSIAAPGLFADPVAFTQDYRKPIEGGDTAQLARLQRRIRPLMLRRTKETVAADLPPKQEQVVSVTLSPAHRRLYDTRLHRERATILKLIDDLDRNRMTILRSLTVLRQLSLAPALVDPDHASTRSSKIDVLLEMVEDIVAGGHRALVFSQFTGFLRLVRDRLDAAGIGYAYLDGRTRDRQKRIEAFRTGDDPLFLISLKAGGFGLTLTEADYVFVLDPWWNPAAEAQAVDRTHRIGQDKHVHVYRLVAADTIEEKVLALQERKRDLFRRVVGEGGDLSAPLSADDIRGLLQE